MAEELHVLFGGGQVGRPLARILLGRGKRVRIVKRSGSGLPEGVELVRGDAADLNFCVEAARGASTVYHCMNPPYYARVWAELLPRYMSNLIVAAGRSGARLVVLDNVYMLGRRRESRSTKMPRYGHAAGRERSGRASPNECGRHTDAAMFGRRLGAHRTTTGLEGHSHI